jgi:hypothetical protein
MLTSVSQVQQRQAFASGSYASWENRAGLLVARRKPCSRAIRADVIGQICRSLYLPQNKIGHLADF